MRFAPGDAWRPTRRRRRLGDASGDAEYGAAVASYERARDALDAARGPRDFVAICRGIWSGRRAMARVRARLQLETPPNPDPRKLVVGDEAVPFWRAPGHFAFWFRGYFGSGEGCLPVRMLQGFPLGRRFAEPAADVLARPRG